MGNNFSFSKTADLDGIRLEAGISLYETIGIDLNNIKTLEADFKLSDSIYRAEVRWFKVWVYIKALTDLFDNSSFSFDFRELPYLKKEKRARWILSVMTPVVTTPRTVFQLQIDQTGYLKEERSHKPKKLSFENTVLTCATRISGFDSSDTKQNSGFEEMTDNIFGDIFGKMFNRP